MSTIDVPKPGQWLRLNGELLRVVSATPNATGADLVLRHSDGSLLDRSESWETLAVARVQENDGAGKPENALAALWGRWMQYASPRLRSAALATRSLKPFAHQDEAVFDHMLPQPKLRFLLADEPGTGKTIMTGMYLVEGRRQGLIPSPSLVVVPAHLVQKWREELEDFFGIRASILTPEVARDPKDLDPRVDVWIASLDLFTHNPDVRRKAAGARASWSLAVFDEAHRLTPTSRYLAAAQELANRSHHLLLLTATPHRGKEHFFRGLCNLLDPEMYPWEADNEKYEKPLRPSKLSFLRRMKEELRDRDGTPLFPHRFAETMPVILDDLELGAYEAVMEYAQSWYGDNATLALSIYGKRAASSLIAAEATLHRRLTSLSGSATKRGHGQVPDAMADGLKGARSLSDGFEDPEDLERIEDLIVTAATKDKPGEQEAVRAVLDQVRVAIEHGGTPAKWSVAEKLMAKHGIAPGKGQLLVFTEFADTARWLASEFTNAGYSVDTLEGAVDHKARHAMQRRFLDGEFQILVSTDAGGEGINLQSAHVMIDWDIPWSLVRLEQRMGRLHRIGQKHNVHIYHLVAPATREGRVQQVMLGNLEAAAKSLGGRIFDLLDATVARAGGFDFARALSEAQTHPTADINVPDIETLKSVGEALVNEDKHLRAKVDQAAAEERFRADRLEAINPVIVDAFVDVLTQAQKWQTSAGPAPGIRRLHSNSKLPKSFEVEHDALIAADGTAVQRARSDDATLDSVVVLGPTEDAFSDLVTVALRDGQHDLLRGCQLVDTGSITEYTLLVYESELRMHDGVRQIPRPAPILIRWSGAGAFPVSWESLMSLRTPTSAAVGNRPSPAQLADGDAEAKSALKREVEHQKSERLGWIEKARIQLSDYEDRFYAEVSDLPKAERQSRIASFNARKASRRAQLEEIENVQATAVRLVGWATVKAGITLDQLGYEPNAEKVAVGTVIAELQALGYLVDDRQTAGVGYDLLARHKSNGDQRCVEVKGFTESMGPVSLEQNEWAQALQRRDDYWLYVVDNCGRKPRVCVRAQNPAELFGGGAGKIQRFQIKLSQLREQVSQ
jgi:superfamily II DNA or RNA helicase